MKCKRIVFVDRFNNEGKPIYTKTLLGIITEELGDFVRFKTANNEYLVNRTYILSIQDTEEEFFQNVENFGENIGGPIE